MNSDDIFDISIGLVVFTGLIVFLVMYNQAIVASQGQTINIRDFNLILERDCDSKGGGYISFDKKQGCIIYYPYYNNIKY